MQQFHRLLTALAFTASHLVAGTFVAGALVAGTPASADEVNLKTAAISTGLLNKMIEIKTLAGLDGASAGDLKLTIFAPSDDAFAAMPAEIRDKLLAPQNRGLLADLLMHHAVIGEYPTQRLLNASARHYGVDAVDGSEIEFTIRPRLGSIDIHGAKVVVGDIVASNGILHVIDKVLIPHAVMKALNAPPGPQVTAEAADVAE